MTQSGRGPVLSRRTLLRWGALVGAGAALTPLVGCAGPTGTAGPDTFTISLNRSLVSLDNKLNQFDAAVTVQRAVRQALTRIGPDLKTQLVLAEQFDLTGPTEWTVRLAAGARYSDGTPVAIADVTTALEMYQQVQGSFVAGFFPEWPAVEPLDDRTFTLRTQEPIPTLDYLMSNILITPAAANKPEELQDGVGSGPYVVQTANRGTGDYTLTINENYWGPKPSISTVQVRFMPDETSRVVALRSGEVDVIDAISPDAGQQLAGVPKVSIERVEGTRINQLFYNFRKQPGQPLADPKVREALTYAIDGQSLAQNVLVGSVKQAEGVIATSLAGAIKTGQYVYDPDKAKQMLASLGVSDLEIKIIWERGEFASDTSVMEAVAEMLGAVGVRTSLQQFEPGGDISQWRQGKAGDWDVLGNGYPGPTGLALTPLQGMFAGTAEKEETRDTYHGYIFPEITDLITKASQETDPTTRNATLATAQQQIWATWPCLWAFVPQAVVANRARVTGIELSPTNSYNLAQIRLEV